MRLFSNIYFKNIFWNFINQFGKSGFQIIVTLILARLLVPENFGTIAMVTIITQFADLIIDSGFLLGIVQVKDIKQSELTAVFYLNLFIGILCTLIIYLGAPLIANFYNDPDLIEVARVLSFSCIFTSSAVVQHGLMIRQMNYKSRTIAQLISQVFSGLIAIYLAYKGYGVMSLVYYSIIQTFLSALLYWLQSSWRPSLSFKFVNLSRIWGFSSNILGVTLLGNIAGRIDLFIIGKFFDAKSLGLYSKTKDFAMLPATVGSEIMSLSMFPILSRLEGDEFNSSFKKSLKILIFFAAFGFALLCVNVKEILLFLLGANWIPAQSIFFGFFIIAFFYLINSFFTSVINATGQSRVNLKKELIQSPLRILLLIAIYFMFRPTNTLPFIYFWIIYYIGSNFYSQVLLSRICTIKLFEISKIGVQYILFVTIAGLIAYFSFDLNSNLLNVLVRSVCFVIIFLFELLIFKDNIIQTLLTYFKKAR